MKTFREMQIAYDNQEPDLDHRCHECNEVFEYIGPHPEDLINQYSLCEYCAEHEAEYEADNFIEKAKADNFIEEESDRHREMMNDMWSTEQSASNHPFADY